MSNNNLSRPYPEQQATDNTATLTGSSAMDAELDILRQERDVARALNSAWNRAMSDAGCAGSEFIDDPKRCAERFRSNQATMLGSVKKKHVAMEKVRRLEAALAPFAAKVRDLEVALDAVCSAARAQGEESVRLRLARRNGEALLAPVEHGKEYPDA